MSTKLTFVYLAVPCACIYKALVENLQSRLISKQINNPSKMNKK